MTKHFLLFLLVLLVAGLVWWLQVGYPVLYERSIPPQQISRWEVITLEGWQLAGSFYQLNFQGKGVIGYTTHGPTVLVLLGEGHLEVEPKRAQQTGRLALGPPPKLQRQSLPKIEVAFSKGYLRLSPKDSAWPQGRPQEDPQAQQEAQTLHAEKLPRYLSQRDQVRLPKAGVRVIELETEQGSLLLLDSRQTAVYWLAP